MFWCFNGEYVSFTAEFSSSPPPRILVVDEDAVNEEGIAEDSAPLLTSEATSSEGEDGAMLLSNALLELDFEGVKAMFTVDVNSVSLPPYCLPLNRSLRVI